MTELSRRASLARRARDYVDALLAPLDRLLEARDLARQRMVDLVRERYETLGHARLFLYVKRLPGTRIPRGLYWGTAFPSGGGPPLDSLAPPRYLIRHIPGRMTGSLIRRVAADHRHREIYFDFDRRRLALNRVHADASRALDRVRKILRAVPPGHEAASPLPDLARIPDLHPEAGPILELARPFLAALLNLDARLIDLRDRYAERPVQPLYALRLVEDADRMNGHLAWLVLLHPPLSVRMTDREMRRCRIPKSLRKRFAPFEAERAWLARMRRHLTDRLGLVTRVLRRATKEVERDLELSLGESGQEPAASAAVIPLPRCGTRLTRGAGIVQD